MLPRMIQPQPRIVRFMPNPTAVLGIDVRSVRVSRLIAEVGMFLRTIIGCVSGG